MTTVGISRGKNLDFDVITSYHGWMSEFQLLLTADDDLVEREDAILADKAGEKMCLRKFEYPDNKTRREISKS